jgi:predicted ester cyclase
MSPSAWPVRNAGYGNGWRGLPDLLVDIEDMFSAHDKVVTRLVWRGTHTGSYAGIKATGKRVPVPDFAHLAFRRRQSG